MKMYLNETELFLYGDSDEGAKDELDKAAKLIMETCANLSGKPGDELIVFAGCKSSSCFPEKDRFGIIVSSFESKTSELTTRYTPIECGCFSGLSDSETSGEMLGSDGSPSALRLVRRIREVALNGNHEIRSFCPEFHPDKVGSEETPEYFVEVKVYSKTTTENGDKSSIADYVLDLIEKAFREQYD